MMQTFNSSRTAEILARYRPIAPKPPDHDHASNTNSDPSNMPDKNRDSAYMQSVWPHLQARPRTRKRGRALLAPSPPSTKRLKPGFAFSPCLNVHVPVEKDLLQQLQAREVQFEVSGVVVPRPIRLVSSAITVHPRTISNQEVMVQGPMKAEKIEKEVESEALPTLISDSKNRVRLANSAYNRLIGQPECCWLDSVSCNKICGEVVLQLPDSAVEEFVPRTNGFFCLVMIEWGNSEYKNSITTFGEAVRLVCESRDYMFAWRFHTQGAVTSAPNF